MSAGLTAPTNLTVEIADATQAILHWDASPDAEHYGWYVSENIDGTGWVQVRTPDTGPIIDRTFIVNYFPGHILEWRVTSVNEASDADQSEPSNVAVLDTVTRSGYATRADMINRWGEKKLIELTNLIASQNTAQTMNTAQLQRSLDAAASRIDSRLSGTRYVIPLTGMNAADTAEVKEICMRAALVWLNESKVAKALDAEGKPTTDVYADHAKYVQAKLNLIATGLMKLSATTKGGRPTGVTVGRCNP